LRGALQQAGGNVGSSASPIVPLIVGENERAVALAEALQADGFDTRAIRPPTVPKGTARLRVTVRYPVADDDLTRFAARVAEQLSKAPLA
jgi:8-amino-7-oxononanoate synthase